MTLVVLLDVCPNAAIEGAKPAHGTQRRCAPYGSVPVLAHGQPVIDAAGQPKWKDVVPDRVVRGFVDDQVGPSGRYIIDTMVAAADVPSVADAAAKKPLVAAARAYVTKINTYTPVMKSGDVLLPVVCETHGGLHDCVKKRLLAWAKLVRQADNTMEAAGLLRAGTFTPSLMALWQRRLSVALLHARVNLVDSAMDKLRGVPARSNTLAYRISHPARFVQEFGRLGGRF